MHGKIRPMLYQISCLQYGALPLECLELIGRYLRLGYGVEIFAGQVLAVLDLHLVRLGWLLGEVLDDVAALVIPPCFLLLLGSLCQLLQLYLHLRTRLLVLGLSWRFVVEHRVWEWRLDITDVFEIAEVTDDLLVHLSLGILLG